MKFKKIKTPLIAVFSPLLFSTLVNAQTAGQYTISGKIEDLKNEMVYLSSDHKDVKIMDSVRAKNGEFSFQGKTPGALIFHLRMGERNYLNIPVDGGEVIDIDGKMGELSKSDVRGAKMLPAWKAWFSSWASITGRAGQLYKTLDSVTKAGGNDSVRKYIDEEFAKLSLRTIDSVESLVKKYPSSPITPFVIIDRFVNYPNPEKAASTYAALAPAAKNSLYGKELEASIKITAKTAVGVKPNFTLPDTAGKPLVLSSLKGKVVLVDFWASWCVPCRKENPNLVKAYAKYHNKGFEIVGVSLDDKKSNWMKAISADQLSWLQVSDLKGWKSDLAVEYGIRSIPTNFLVDASGKIIAKDLRGDALEKQLEKIYE